MIYYFDYNFIFIVSIFIYSFNFYKKIDKIIICFIILFIIFIMDYLSKLKSITQVKHVRKSQLEIQKNIDIELYKLNKTCPEIVSEYLLFQRYLSRIQQNEMINSNIMDMITIFNKHFDENNKIYKNFYDILKCDNKCECLEKELRIKNLNLII